MKPAREKRATEAVAEESEGPEEEELASCNDCSKFRWSSRELAEREVERLRSAPRTRKAELLGIYTCPAGEGWQSATTSTVKWISLCVGEHK